jgi:hypothetical protein
MIPLMATITVGGRSTYWIPLALFWILLSPLVLLFFPLAFVWVNPFRAIAAVWQILSAVSGATFAFKACGKSIEVEL